MSAADRQKWDEVYRTAATGPGAPSPFLISLASRLPVSGRALDIAGGTGAEALWLARRGMAVTLLDISSVALDLARSAAERQGLALDTLAADLDHDPLPAGPFALITCFNFLDRRLFPQISSRLAPGGLFVYLQPTRKNLERHPQPSARFLLADGELPSLIPDLEILSHEETWFAGRHEARLLATKRLLQK